MYMPRVCHADMVISGRLNDKNVMQLVYKIRKRGIAVWNYPQNNTLVFVKIHSSHIMQRCLNAVVRLLPLLHRVL